MRDKRRPGCATSRACRRAGASSRPLRVTQRSPSSADAGGCDRPGGRRRRFVAAAVLLAALPLSMARDPAADRPARPYRALPHHGRAGRRRPLASHYAVHWASIGNLGRRRAGARAPAAARRRRGDAAGRAADPVRDRAGDAVAGREVHGRIPPARAVRAAARLCAAVPAWVRQFRLAAALALAGLALWIRLARRVPALWRAAVRADRGHCLGCATVSAGRCSDCSSLGAEWARSRGRAGAPLARRGAAALVVAPMAWPRCWRWRRARRWRAIPATGFNWLVKAQWLASLLRERWKC